MDYIEKLEDAVNFGAEASVPLLQKSDNLMNKIKNMLTKDNIIYLSIVVAVIIVIILLVYYFNKNNTDKFAETDINDTETIANDTETGEIILMHRDSCPYSNKMYEIIKTENFKMGKHNIKVVDINSSEGGELSKKYNIRGTPGFINKHTNKISMGLKSISEHFNDLQSVQSGETVSSKNIILIGNENCPFCVKMKDHLDLKLGKDTYKFIDSNSPEGTKYMKEKNSDGVPLTINTSNNKHVIGFNENVLEELN